MNCKLSNHFSFLEFIYILYHCLHVYKTNYLLKFLQQRRIINWLSKLQQRLLGSQWESYKNNISQIIRHPSQREKK